MMRRIRILSTTAPALLAAAMMLALPGESSAQQTAFQAKLQGFSEVPSISSTGTGSFRATLSDDGSSLSYKLTFSGLSAPVTQSHIHFGQQHTTGAIMVFLCQTASNPDPTGLAPQCVNAGTVGGTITSANIIQAGGQGIGNGEFDEFVLALKGSSGYANVHTTSFPSGEIRGIVASH
jgi:hypothetical protein